MEVSITWSSERYNNTSLGVPGSTPTAGMPTRVRARLYTSRRVVFVLVNTEGDVGSVSRYTEIRGSEDDGVEVGFCVAAKKRSSGLFNLGTDADSIDIFPCFERTIRSYGRMGRVYQRGNAIASYLIRFVRILVLQGSITATLEPMRSEFRWGVPGMDTCSHDQTIHRIREE